MDQQREWDEEETRQRLAALVKSIEDEREAQDSVARLQYELRKAKARLKTTRRALGERAFIERNRHKTKR